MTRGALAAWRQRFTEREEWRLTEHFFRALFDFGFLSDLAADSFKRVLIGSVGGFIAFFLPMHTATRLALPVIDRVRSMNAGAALCARHPTAGARTGRWRWAARAVRAALQ